MERESDRERGRAKEGELLREEEKGGETYIRRERET
jgi:hypothetical protein